jgi:catecholate siderophore receptor
VVKPAQAVSLYGSYSVSYVPSSGDQFSSLTAITSQLEPEKLTGYEVGGKWQTRGGLAVTTALYRLNRTNTRSVDPNDPTRIVQTGSQRTDGSEVGIAGAVSSAWNVAGGYAWQNARVTSATASAPAGAQVGQVPHHTLSLWNDYRVTRRVRSAIGVVYRSDMFVAVDNSVVLPSYIRVDASSAYELTAHTRLQVNVENLFDRRYVVNADSNTNISPGSPRAIRLTLATTF